MKTIAVAKELGKLSLAIRAAVEHEQTRDAGTTFGCDVSPEIARQSAVANESATVVVFGGDKPKEYSVKKHDLADMAPHSGCDLSGDVAVQGAALAKQ